MQEASDEFVEAVAAHRTWVPPRLRTDWAGDGYDGDGTIDDLSPQMAETWEVDHTLDDGYPDAVTFVSGTSVPELTTELTGRAQAAPEEPISAVAYWSPLRTDSPVHGYDRDVAPVTLDAGLVTSAGVEYARVFTGQMVNTPVRGGKAELQTISATRLKLMRLVLPPAFTSLYSVGLYATWPISFNLFKCGLYPGPRPRDTGTAWHVPMHGSAWPMVPSSNIVYDYADSLTGFTFPQWRAYEQRQGDANVTLIDEVPWTAGPYVSAPDVRLTASYRSALYTQELRFERSAGDAFSQAGHAGRLEMWVKGDATDVNGAPGGSGTVSRLCSLWMQADAPASPYVQMGITPSRHVEVKVYDGTNTRTLTSASTLPTDGAWYFVGCGYDMLADRLWVNLGGTVASSSASMATGALPATDTYAAGFPAFLSVLPVAEVTFTVGAQANVDNYPLWRDDASFAPTATLAPSRNKLVAIAETEPREAWVTITEYAKAELASVRLTETDEFQYLPLGWWVREEQQRVVDVFDTTRNAAAFDVDLDPTKIRNSIKVSFNEIRAVNYDADYGGYRVIYELPDDIRVTIPPGVTILRFPYSNVGILPIQYVTMWDNFPIAGANVTQVTLCDVPDGTGIYATSDQVEVEFFAWDATSATLRFNNKTTLTWYLANNGDFPALILTGVSIESNSTYALDEDTASIAARGVRALDVSANILQEQRSARRLARNLKMALRKAVPTIGSDQQGVEVLGNPLRQPGDLATFRDPETGVDESAVWRLRGVHHKGRGADYRQAVVARRALPIMIIGQGRIGESLIGPASE